MVRPRSILEIPLINKIAGIASIGGTVTSVALLRRFLADIVGVVALTVLSAMVGGLLVICAFYWLYVGLVSYGMTPQDALIVLSVTTLIVTLGLVTWTILRLQHLRHISPSMRTPEIPGLTRVTGVVNAFIEGFTEGHTKA